MPFLISAVAPTALLRLADLYLGLFRCHLSAWRLQMTNTETLTLKLFEKRFVWAAETCRVLLPSALVMVPCMAKQLWTLMVTRVAYLYHGYPSSMMAHRSSRQLAQWSTFAGSSMRRRPSLAHNSRGLIQALENPVFPDTHTVLRHLSGEAMSIRAVPAQQHSRLMATSMRGRRGQ